MFSGLGKKLRLLREEGDLQINRLVMYAASQKELSEECCALIRQNALLAFAENKETLDKASTFKKLVEFAIEKKLAHMSFDGFTFDLSGTDPKQEELNALQEEVKDLRAQVNKLLLGQMGQAQPLKTSLLAGRMKNG